VRSAYRIIAGKGATNYAIGLSAARIVEAVLRNERAILPVSSVLRGYRGIDGIALSVPSIVGAGGVQRVVDVPMDDVELARLHRSAEALQESLRSVRACPGSSIRRGRAKTGEISDTPVRAAPHHGVSRKHRFCGLLSRMPDAGCRVPGAGCRG